MAMRSFTGPRIMLGTEKVLSSQCIHYVQRALESGFRMFDTAQVYGNEDAVGQAIINSEVPREKIYVSTKIAKGFKKNPSTVKEGKEAVHRSLKKSGLDYLDAVMIHHPGVDKTDSSASDCRLATWQAIEELNREGLVKVVGVSNFSVPQLRVLLANSMIRPSFNQLEYHPWCQQTSIVNFCKQEGIALQAHSALARNEKSHESELLEMARKYNASPAQLLLRYSQLSGFLPVVRAVQNQHLDDIAHVEDVDLCPEDMGLMNSWDKGLEGSILPWLIEGNQE